MVEAASSHRVNGHLHLPALRTALEHEFAQPVGPAVHSDEVSAGAHRTATESLNGNRDIVAKRGDQDPPP